MKRNMIEEFKNQKIGVIYNSIEEKRKLEDVFHKNKCNGYISFHTEKGIIFLDGKDGGRYKLNAYGMEKFLNKKYKRIKFKDFMNNVKGIEKEKSKTKKVIKIKSVCKSSDLMRKNKVELICLISDKKQIIETLVRTQRILLNKASKEDNGWVFVIIVCALFYLLGILTMAAV